MSLNPAFKWWFNIIRVITRLLIRHFGSARGYLEGYALARIIAKKASRRISPWTVSLLARDASAAGARYNEANAVMRALQSDHRVNKNNRLSSARVGYLSVAESAYLFGQFLRPAKCSDNVCMYVYVCVYGKERERERIRQIYIRVPSSPGGNYRR